MAKYITPNKTASIPLMGGGVYIGTVTSIVDSQFFVEIPAVAQDFSFGPCLTTVLTPTVGSDVVCCFLGHELDQVIVIGEIK